LSQVACDAELLCQGPDAPEAPCRFATSIDAATANPCRGVLATGRAVLIRHPFSEFSITSHCQEREIRMETRSRRANGLPRTIVLLIVVLAGSHQAVAAKSRTFDIPEGSLARSLYEFSLQSDLQVLFDSKLVDGIVAHGVRGELEASDALSKMLSGTALIFEFVNEKTVAIKRPAPRLTRIAMLTGAAAESSVARGPAQAQEVPVKPSDAGDSNEGRAGERVQEGDRGTDRSREYLRSIPEI